MELLHGLISSMERFALHDGPGIRTLVFMKGCPMRCLWCSSPQTQNPTPEILYDAARCRRCGRCTDVCPSEAMTMTENEGVRIQRQDCNGCGECAEACPNQALELVGTAVRVGDLLREVKRDGSFYRRSNGGVTLGGGEPTMQHEFAAEFLKRCKEQYIHTAMETCGYAEWRHLEGLLPYLDLVYMDMKHMDPVAHRELTGVSNELILDNVRRTAACCSVIIRIPVVPGCNDSDENILRTAEFAVRLGERFERVEVLPYHEFGVQTYAELGRKYELDHVRPPTDGRMKRIREIIESRGAAAQIGG